MMAPQHGLRRRAHIAGPNPAGLERRPGRTESSVRRHVAYKEHGWMSNAPQQQPGGQSRSPQLGGLGNLGSAAGAGLTRWILIGVVVILLVCAGFTVLLVTLSN